MSRRSIILIAAIPIVVAVLAGLVLRWTGGSPAAPTGAAPSTVATVVPAEPVSPSSVPTPPPPPDEGTADPDPPPAGGRDASPGAAPYSKTRQARKAWEPVVTGFGHDFTRTTPDKPAIWQNRLKPYVTADVAEQLATVDQTRVPAGRYTDYQVLSYDDEQLVAQLNYREGWSLAAYLIFDGQTWHIYRYEPYEQ